MDIKICLLLAGAAFIKLLWKRDTFTKPINWSCALMINNDFLWENRWWPKGNHTIDLGGQQKLGAKLTRIYRKGN